eukprot:Clim_evm123s157 gene=Clim_evmTU123s157
MFSKVLGVVEILLHSGAAIALSLLTLESFAYQDYWYIFGFFAAPSFLLFTFTIFGAVLFGGL